jgi:hypothetical protein
MKSAPRLNHCPDGSFGENGPPETSIFPEPHHAFQISLYVTSCSMKLNAAARFHMRSKGRCTCVRIQAPLAATLLYTEGMLGLYTEGMLGLYTEGMLGAIEPRF